MLSNFLGNRNEHRSGDAVFYRVVLSAERVFVSEGESHQDSLF
jgi:hypothetical protein